MIDFKIHSFPRPRKLVDSLKPRVRSIDIPIETIHEVLKQYDLTLTGAPSNLSLSRRTENVVLPTSAGKKVLKHYRDHLRSEGILYIHSILSRLDELSFPALKLFPSLCGTDFVSLAGGNFAVFDFVQGSNYSQDFILPSDRARLIEASGKFLATFHRSMNGFLPRGAHHLGFVSYTGVWQRDFHWFSEKVQTLKERSFSSSSAEAKQAAEWLNRHADVLLDRFGSLDENLQKASLLRTIIHGDFGLNNLIIQKDGGMVLTDFETTRLEWRLSDMVSALSRYRSRVGMVQFEGIRHFLKGYQSVYPIPVDEWEHLPNVWHFVKLRSMFINWINYFELGQDPSKLSSARQAYEQAEWSMTHAGRLLSLVS